MPGEFFVGTFTLGEEAAYQLWLVRIGLSFLAAASFAETTPSARGLTEE